MSVKGLRAEHAEATRTALVKAARELFVQNGYAETSAEEIVARARVTRGAMYHHFKDKKDLFSAVCDEVGAECARKIEEAAIPLLPKEPWKAFTKGIDAFLDHCMEGEFPRVVLVEAPAVGGWEEWREHAEKHEMGLIKMGLQILLDAGLIKKQSVDTLAWMVFSVLNEGAMLIGRADDKTKARKEVGQTVRTLLEGLRI